MLAWEFEEELTVFEHGKMDRDTAIDICAWYKMKAMDKDWRIAEDSLPKPKAVDNETCTIIFPARIININVINHERGFIDGWLAAIK